MITYTLVILILASHNYGTTTATVTGFTNRENCVSQANQIQQIQLLDRGLRYVRTMCVEVK